MAHIKLSTTLKTLEQRLGQAERLAIAADRWSAAAARFPSGVPKFTLRRRDAIIEMAFFRAFLAWEAFLEESFVLYLLGKSPPRGRPPRCIVEPKATRKLIQQMLIPEGRKYIRWSNAGDVAARAKRFFHDGWPYATYLTAHQNKLQDIEGIRNAIAHTSGYSKERFERLVRRELTALPTRSTIGEFLRTIVPGSPLPESFFERYLGYFRFISSEIVPI
jgi:hypothetical protein